MTSQHLSLVTWNVWFDEHRFDERASLLLDALAAADADVICLQEVTVGLLGRLLAADALRDYEPSDRRAASVDPYGTLTLSRLPVRSVERHELPTSMERDLTVMLVEAPGGLPVAVGSVHLESKRWNGDVRVEQLGAALPRMRAAAPDSVLCGDFNFDPEAEAEQRALMEGGDFRDVWDALRHADPGYTVDTTRNAMTAWHKGKDKHVRFDRVVLRSPSRRLAPRSVELLGTEAPAGDPRLFPSDHFGLRATFRVG